MTLDWIEFSVETTGARLARAELRNCYCWLETLGNAEDEFTAAWMRALEANRGHPIPNLTIYRRISKALARWREFRGA